VLRFLRYHPDVPQAHSIPWYLVVAFGVLVAFMIPRLLSGPLGLGMSIVSVFWAGLIASLASTAMLAPDIVRTLRPRLRGGLLREMMQLGLPTLPAGLALMVVQVLDRLLMQILVDTRTAGIYGANYRLGIFGSMAHPELTAQSPHRASGNYGLLDQAAALAWVKQAGLVAVERTANGANFLPGPAAQAKQQNDGKENQ
jgi:hypothetical protein